MKRRFRFSFVMLAGILLLAAGLIGLATVPDLMQYAFLPPAESADSGLDQTLADESMPDQFPKELTLLDKYEKAMETMAEVFPNMTIHGVKSGSQLESERSSQGSVYLYSTGPCWNEVYTPKIISGRPILGQDAEENNRVIVLDEKTAFTLFRDEDPIGKTVKLDGAVREVVGVAAHSRQIGETGENAAWIPLGSAADCSLMVVSVPRKPITYYTMFESQARDAFGSGTVISMEREKTRAMLPLLVVFVILAVWLLKRLFSRAGHYGRIQIEKVRAESKKRYTLPLLPYAIGHLLPAGLLIALLVAAGYGVAILAISPLKIFPEWIPETLGEYTSWIDRFWALVGQAAEPVNIRTPELARLQLWSGLIRWGTLLFLLGAAKKTLTGFIKGREEE